jgi:hypothetical protein
MKVIRTALIFFLLSCSTAFAAPASDATIEKLLAVTKIEKLAQGIQNQVEAQVNASMQQALRGKQPNAKQQVAIDHMHTRMNALVHDMLSWERLEPLYIRLYKETFTEEEVAGMLAFYQTPAGQAVINKMPLLTQKTMLEMQKMTMMASIELKTIQANFIADLKSSDS